MDNKTIVKNHYDSNVETEWLRLEKHYFEFEITKHFMNKYIKPGDSVLDVSGGPGRYSLYFAQKGCDVTLVDLSPNNAEFAKKKAHELGLNMNVLAGDACNVDKIITGEYDHVFLMGALYHLKEKADRSQAVRACLNLLKPNGIFYVSFISVMAGMIYSMKEEPSVVVDKIEKHFLENFIEKEDYIGSAFTEVCFLQPESILSLIEKYNLEKLHFFGQEGITSPCEDKIMLQSQDVIEKWLDISLKVCEREDLINYSEHLMYIGRKTI